MFSIKRLIDEAKCYELVRELRWSDGVKCPHFEWFLTSPDTLSSLTRPERIEL